MANRKGLPSGHIAKPVVMDEQGRAWKSPRGGMQSFITAPRIEMRDTLALVVAIAVRRAGSDLVVDNQARRICIKWPA